MRLEVVAVLLAVLNATSVLAQEVAAAPAVEGALVAAEGEEVAVAKHNPRYNRVSSSRNNYPAAQAHHRRRKSSSTSCSSSSSSSSSSSDSSCSSSTSTVTRGGPQCGRVQGKPHQQVVPRKPCPRECSDKTRRYNPYTALTRPAHPFGRRQDQAQRCHRKSTSCSSSSSSSCSSSSSSSSCSSSSSHCRPSPICDCPCETAKAKVLADTEIIQAYFADCPVTATPFPFAVSSIVSPFATATVTSLTCGTPPNLACCYTTIPFATFATGFSTSFCQGDPVATVYYYNQIPDCPDNLHNGTWVVTAVEAVMGQAAPYVNQIDYIWKKREGCNFWLESVRVVNSTCVGVVGLRTCTDPLCLPTVTP